MTSQHPGMRGVDPNIYPTQFLAIFLDSNQHNKNNKNIIPYSSKRGYEVVVRDFTILKTFHVCHIHPEVVGRLLVPNFHPFKNHGEDNISIGDAPSATLARIREPIWASPASGEKGDELEKTAGLVGTSWELELLNMSSGCKKRGFLLQNLGDFSESQLFWGA